MPCKPHTTKPFKVTVFDIIWVFKIQKKLNLFIYHSITRDGYINTVFVIVESRSISYFTKIVSDFVGVDDSTFPIYSNPVNRVDIPVHLTFPNYQ